LGRRKTGREKKPWGLPKQEWSSRFVPGTTRMKNRPKEWAQERKKNQTKKETKSRGTKIQVSGLFEQRPRAEVETKKYGQTEKVGGTKTAFGTSSQGD